MTTAPKTEERIVRAMDFAWQAIITDKFIRADPEFRAFFDPRIDGGAYEALTRLTVAGAVVRQVAKEWSVEFDAYGEYLPRWKQWLRRMVPKRLRPVTVHHYHVCPHIEPPERTSHTEFLSDDCDSSAS